MNKWRSFVAGQVADRPAAGPALQPAFESKGRGRSWGQNDVIAKRKRVARWRARKGYK